MSTSLPLPELADQLRAALSGKPFGGIRFWRFALLRPQDQAYELVSTHVEGDRLDLVFVHASHQGLPGVLSVWSPEGLEIAGGAVSLRQAARLRLDDNEAWLDGEEYRIRTPRGEGAFPFGDSPALTLET